MVEKEEEPWGGTWAKKRRRRGKRSKGRARIANLSESVGDIMVYDKLNRMEACTEVNCKNGELVK